ncbi:hypothetical protein HDV00_005195 [Rhizophlyctis rosea]|nr:hypothetical protein HDV00_005195 [Rhizophlyctis rosea]
MERLQKASVPYVNIAKILGKISRWEDPWKSGGAMVIYFHLWYTDHLIPTALTLPFFFLLHSYLVSKNLIPEFKGLVRPLSSSLSMTDSQTSPHSPRIEVLEEDAKANAAYSSTHSQAPQLHILPPDGEGEEQQPPIAAAAEASSPPPPASPLQSLTSNLNLNLNLNLKATTTTYFKAVGEAVGMVGDVYDRVGEGVKGVGSVASGMEKVRNLLTWKKPMKTAQFLVVYTALAAILMFAPYKFLVKFATFILGYYFFIVLGLRSNFPRYKLECDPVASFFKDVPSDVVDEVLAEEEAVVEEKRRAPGVLKLPEEEVVLFEWACTHITPSNLLDSQWGTLYLTDHHVAFVPAFDAGNLNVSETPLDIIVLRAEDVERIGLCKVVSVLPGDGSAVEVVCSGGAKMMFRSFVDRDETYRVLVAYAEKEGLDWLRGVEEERSSSESVRTRELSVPLKEDVDVMENPLPTPIITMQPLSPLSAFTTSSPDALESEARPPHPQVTVTDPVTHYNKIGLPDFTDYAVITAEPLNTTVRRRYTDFVRLRAALDGATNAPLDNNGRGKVTLTLPELPGKAVIGRFDAKKIEARRKGLEVFLNEVAEGSEVWSARPFVEFLIRA